MNIKKRLIVCLIVCTVSLFIFAITASAVDIYYYHDFDAQVETVAGMPELPADGVLQSPGRVVLKDSEEAYHTYPAYYIVKNQATFDTDYTALNAATGESYTDASVYMIDIPDGITKISKGKFGSENSTLKMTSVQKVIMPDSITVLENSGWSHCFRNNPSILYIEVSSGVTELGNYTFAQMPKVKEIRFRSGSQLQKIGDNVFTNLPSLREIYIDMSGVTSVGSSAFVLGSDYNRGCDFVQWYNTDGRKVVDLRNITSIAEFAFALSNLGSADKILWPTGLNSLGIQAFRLANIRGIMYIGGGNTDISINNEWTFRGNDIDMIIFGSNVKKINSSLLNSSLPNLVNIVFLADSVDIGTNSDVFKNSSNTGLCRNVYYKSFSTCPGSYNGTPALVTWTSSELQNSVDQCKLQVILTTADGNVTVGGQTAHIAGDDYIITTPATCTEGAIGNAQCMFCGADMDAATVSAPSGHDYQIILTAPSTCTEYGSVTRECQICHDVITEQTTSPLGHDYEGGLLEKVDVSCSVRGYKREQCQREGCGYILITAEKPLAHAFVATVDGSTAHNVCENCGYTYDTVVYEKYTDPSAVDMYITVKVDVDNDGTANDRILVKVTDVFNASVTDNESGYVFSITGQKSTITINGASYKLNEILTGVEFPMGVTKLSDNVLKQWSNISSVSLPDSIEEIGDNVFYRDGKLDLASNRLPKNLRKIGGHLFSGCQINYDIIIFPEGITELLGNNIYNFNDGFSCQSGKALQIVFLGRMSEAAYTWYDNRVRSYYAQNKASEVNGYIGYTFIKNDNLSKVFYRAEADNYITEKTKFLNIRASNNQSSSTNNYTYTDSDGISQTVLLAEVNSPLGYFCNDLTVYENANGTQIDFTGNILYYGRNFITMHGWSEDMKIGMFIVGPGSNDTHLSDEGTDVPATCLTAEGIKYTCLCCRNQIGEIEAKEGGEPALGHTAGDTVLRLVYNNGFDKIGEKTCKCVRCDAGVLVNADAIFVSQGFSILPSGEVYISFSLSKTALNEFNTVNDCAVRYGVFVSNGAVTFDSNGAITNDKAIWAEINPDSQFSRFGITISGLESYADQALAYGAYTIDSSDNVKIIQKDSVTYDGAPVTASGSGITEPITVYTRTYNGIQGVQNQSLALYDRKYFYAYAA